jgi:hypothetical protein
VITRRSGIRLGAGVLFSLVNLAGAVMAAVQGELIHTGIHVGLLLLGVYYVRRILLPGWVVTPDLAIPGEVSDRLTRVEQSVEAVALAIERVGEGQRFMTRLLSDNHVTQAFGAGAAQSVDIKEREEASQVVRP